MHRGVSSVQRRGPGRPRLEDRDSELPKKARALRRDGLSWGQIGEALKIGRSSARRLCQNSVEGLGTDIGTEHGPGDRSPSPPFQNGTLTVPEQRGGRQIGPLGDSAVGSLPEGALELPESLRVFAKLLKRAAGEPEKPKDSDSA